MQLDYRWFDKVNIKKVRKKKHFFNKAYMLIQKEECCYISNRLKELDKSEKTSLNLQYLIAEWEEEKRNLYTALYGIESRFADDFSCIDYEIFEEFLDDLEIDEYDDEIEVSSSYSEYIHKGCSNDCLNAIIDGYISAIVERGDLNFRGFDVGDEFYWLVLNKKFYQEKEE